MNNYTAAHKLRINAPSAPLDFKIQLPGSKSYTNRALIVAAIAGGRSVLKNPSTSDDSDLMKAALTKLGVTIQENRSDWIVSRHEPFPAYKGIIDIGAAGTTMRFLTSLIASIPGTEVELRGSSRMHQRPITELIKALRACGADIQHIGTDGCPPIFIKGKNLVAPTEISIDGSVSSQFITSLLLSSPRIENLVLKITGKAVSTSYVKMAIDTIRGFGGTIAVENEFTLLDTRKNSYLPSDYYVELDASGASYFWGLAAISGGTATVTGTKLNSSQGDMIFPRLLNEMGCSVTSTESSVTVQGPKQLKAISACMEECPDTAQTLAVIASCARGETIISGLSTLKVKETDRILALKSELQKCGIESHASENSLSVIGGIPRHSEIMTYEDHRMALSFSLFAALPSGITICEPKVVTKSLPDYWKRLKGLGFSIEELP